MAKRKDAEDWLEWAQAKYDAAQERFAWSDRSDSPTMDSYSTLISLIESGMASRAKDEADAQKKRTAIEQVEKPLMELAEQMETLGRNGMAFSQKAMIDAAQMIKSVLYEDLCVCISRDDAMDACDECYTRIREAIKECKERGKHER